MKRASCLAFVLLLSSPLLPCHAGKEMRASVELSTCSAVPFYFFQPQTRIYTSSTAPIKWSDCLSQKPEWYASDEAARIADNVLLYQRDTGGWPKNIDMAGTPTKEKKGGAVKQK